MLSCVSRHEYGEPEVTLELVDSMDEAIDHLHAFGSGHTECIVTGRCLLRVKPTSKSFTGITLVASD